MIRANNTRLAWQSKLVLLAVVPWTAMHAILQTQWWFAHEANVALTVLGISGVFGLIVWRMRAGTFSAAATGATITASLMYSTTQLPYNMSWLHGGLMPLLAVFLLTYLATKAGKKKKEAQGNAESKRGRNAAQVAANLGASALVASLAPSFGMLSASLCAVLAIAALAEAAADTVSSEIGQAFGGKPRMLTTMRVVEPGTDGGITLLGTAAGVFAAAVVAGVGTFCLFSGYACAPSNSGCDVANAGPANQIALVLVLTLAGSLGLLFDSLLGAWWERKGWLNNDAVNFASTLAAPGFTLLLSALISYLQSRL